MHAAHAYGPAGRYRPARSFRPGVRQSRKAAHRTITGKIAPAIERAWAQN